MPYSRIELDRRPVELDVLSVNHIYIKFTTIVHDCILLSKHKISIECEFDASILVQKAKVYKRVKIVSLKSEIEILNNLFTNK